MTIIYEQTTQKKATITPLHTTTSIPRISTVLTSRPMRTTTPISPIFTPPQLTLESFKIKRHEENALLNFVKGEIAKGEKAIQALIPSMLKYSKQELYRLALDKDIETIFNRPELQPLWKQKLDRIAGKKFSLSDDPKFEKLRFKQVEGAALFHWWRDKFLAFGEGHTREGLKVLDKIKECGIDVASKYLPRITHLVAETPTPNQNLGH